MKHVYILKGLDRTSINLSNRQYFSHFIDILFIYYHFSGFLKNDIANNPNTIKIVTEKLWHDFLNNIPEEKFICHFLDIIPTFDSINSFNEKINFADCNIYLTSIEKLVGFKKSIFTSNFTFRTSNLDILPFMLWDKHKMGDNRELSWGIPEFLNFLNSIDFENPDNNVFSFEDLSIFCYLLNVAQNIEAIHTIESSLSSLIPTFDWIAEVEIMVKQEIIERIESYKDNPNDSRYFF